MLSRPLGWVYCLGYHYLIAIRHYCHH